MAITMVRGRFASIAIFSGILRSRPDPITMPFLMETLADDVVLRSSCKEHKMEYIVSID